VSTTEQRPEGGPPAAEAVVITRYPNRRFYDRSRGKYVTLQDIEETVRGGATVTVRDSKTGEELTRAVLTQIILEHHPERMELFPVAILHQLIRANDLVLGLLRDYLRQSLTYVEMAQSAALNPLAAPLHWMRTFLPGLPVLTPGAAGLSPASAGAAEALALRVAELERRLAELQAGPPPAPAEKAAKLARRGKKPKPRKP
jgi:polyhydroxyalkanoate synthesis repressor PhaR